MNSDAFQITATALGALPLGEAAVALCVLISKWYQANKDIRELLGALPVSVSYFGSKLAEIKSPSTEDCSWLLGIVKEFEKELEVVNETVAGYRKVWYKVAKDKAKMQACHDRLAAINVQLDGAILAHNHSMLSAINHKLDSATHACNNPMLAALHDMVEAHLSTCQRDQDPQTASVVTAAMGLADLLMEEMDLNKDQQLSVDELWSNVNIRTLISNRAMLQKLLTNLFDNDGNGTLDYKETVVLAAALQQISKLFYDIRIRCHDDTNYVPCPQIVTTLQSLGYTGLSLTDVSEVARGEYRRFRWDQYRQDPISCSYEGFLNVYLHVVNKYDMWSHAKKRITTGGR